MEHQTGNFMSKRNFILLIIILVIVIIAVLGFLYLRKDTTTPTDPGIGTNFFSQFNPFGTKPTPPVTKPPVDVSGYQPPTAPEQTKLMKVSSMPVAGFTVFTKERLKDVPVAPLLVEEGVPGGETPTTPTAKKSTKVTPTAPLTEFVLALRYVARSNGNIYQTFVDKIQERKFSKTVIPKVYDAYFGNRGNSVVMRYLKSNDETIETFVGALPKELLGGDTTINNEVKGSFLPNNVKDASVSPDGSKIFYLFEDENGVVGTILNFTDNKKTQIFDSPFTEWLSVWPNSSLINLTTKPSANIPGYVYTMNSSGSNLSKILGDINGLTTLGGPNSKSILYGDDKLSLNIYNIDKRSSEKLGLKTLPEKCVWNKTGDFIYCAVPITVEGNLYPDAWYQGVTTFDDQFWKIDVKTGNTTTILDPVDEKGGTAIDGTKLTLDENENYLFFVNKKDSFLWKLDLK